jgi:hypothetical protein
VLHAYLQRCLPAACRPRACCQARLNSKGERSAVIPACAGGGENEMGGPESRPCAGSAKGECRDGGRA